MITKSVIDRILTDALVKCMNRIASNGDSWGVRFPRKIRDSLNRFRRRFCTMGNHAPIEWNNVFDREGNVLAEFTGDEDSVSLDVNLLSRLRDEKGYGLSDIHNHPHGYFGIPVCFSKADFNVALTTTSDGEFIFKSNSVGTANGSMMTIMKKDNFSQENVEDFWMATDLLSEIYNEYAKEFSSVRMGFARDMMDGTIPIDMSQDVTVLNEFVNNLTLDEVGHIEDRLGDVRRLFNNANVEFSVEWGYY